MVNDEVKAKAGHNDYTDVESMESSNHYIRKIGTVRLHHQQ